MLASVGSMVATYRLGEVLGRGGMGVVYRAWDDRLARWVALKLISPDLGADANFRARFLREARLAAAIEHPHIVPVYDAGEDGGTLYLAMRLIDGPDLDSLLDAGPIEPERAANLVVQIAHALAALHMRGMVHRDVTARNVLVPVVDGAEHAYLTDFGLARYAARGGTLTDDGNWAATLDYAAPERLRGERGDARTDVYAVGCLLYRTLAGRPPFPATDKAAKIAAHLTAPPPRLPPAVRDAAPQLQHVIARALAKDPADRHPGILELAAELQASAPRPSAPAAVRPSAVTESDAQWRAEVPSVAAADAPATAASTLVEREAELAQIELALDEAVAGAGSLVILQGAGGIGKSSLLAAGTARLAGRGFSVARGAGSELERALAFGVVRQIFDPLLGDLPDSVLDSLRSGAVRPAMAMLGYMDDATKPVRLEAGTPDLFAIMNGLYWLTTALAQRAPLALVIDDAHRADEASLAWVAFMSTRVRLQPILILLATRDLTPQSPSALESLVYSTATRRIQLPPLSERGVGQLVRATWPEATDEFCAACLAATAGNPFYLRQLVASARATGVTPDAGGARRLRDITPDAVTRLVLARFEGLSHAARALAKACAVLDGPVDLALAAGMAEIGERDSFDAVDALAGAGIVEPSWPLRYAHPLIAAAVDRQMTLGERTRLHERAAQQLEARDAPASAVAQHLIHVQPSGSPERVECLRTAAHEAAAHGTPGTAVTLLERALSEPASPQMAPWVLLELARARRDLGDLATAGADLQRALTLAGDPEVRSELILELTDHDLLQLPDRIALIDGALAQLGDAQRELRFRLEAKAIDLLNLAAGQSTSSKLRKDHDARLARVVAQADGDTASERQLLAIYSGLRTVRASITAAKAKALALRALDDGVLMRRLAEGEWNCDAAIEVLTMVDAFDLADRHARDAERRAREHGAVAATGYIGMLRAIIAWHRGALLEAESLLTPVLAACSHVGDHYVQYVAHQIQACVAIEVGDLDAAERACAEIAKQGPYPMGAPHLRGRLHTARGEPDLAVPELRAAFDLHRSVGRWRSVVMGSPRADLVLALVAAGSHAEAVALAEEEHAAARRFGAPTALAAALRALGHAQGADGVGRFEEAVAVLSGSQAALARAQALCDLGSVQRIGGDVVEARRTLRRAQELCDHIGAKPLGDRVRGELLAAGGKPGRVSPRAAQLLSPAERRVASLAAEGATEFEIAQALFVSVDDASAQLSAALSKLELDSRGDLAQTLLVGG